MMPLEVWCIWGCLCVVSLWLCRVDYKDAKDNGDAGYDDIDVYDNTEDDDNTDDYDNTEDHDNTDNNTFDNNDTDKYDNSDEYDNSDGYDNTDSSANSKVVRFELEIFFFLNVYNWAIQHL